MQTRVMYDSTMFSNASDQNLHTMAHYAYSVLGNTSYCSIVLRVVLVRVMNTHSYAQYDTWYVVQY